MEDSSLDTSNGGLLSLHLQYSPWQPVMTPLGWLDNSHVHSGCWLLLVTGMTESQLSLPLTTMNTAWPLGLDWANQGWEKGGGKVPG